MRKILLSAGAFILSFIQVTAQQKWDRSMVLKSCTIDIKADQFTATTFIEMEFCNPNDREIEGLYLFELKPGQVITAFQLDLNGKYRDGSIEEKWKATNAYNSIVGKRIDPALLTMDYAGHYSLRIYPVPAKGCRKVTMTIQQLLPAEKNNVQYYLPLNVSDTVQNFSLNITVNGSTNPVVKTGLIADRYFAVTNGEYYLDWNAENILLKSPLVFSIPLAAKPEVCIKANEKQTFFALRFQPSFPREYAIQPKLLTVFWDASASLCKRDVNKEISFLKQFISWHNVSQVTIIPFNHKLLDTAVFYTENGFNSRWQQYLQNITYDGSTQLGIIDLSGIRSDMVLLFTDGNNTYGKSKPKTGKTIVSCIHTSNTANQASLQQIVGASGGKVIDLNKTSISTAVTGSSRAENWLLNVSSASGKMIIEQTMPLKQDETLFINGAMSPGIDTLYFQYGSNGRVNHIEKIIVNSNAEPLSSVMDRINMLNNFDHIIRNYPWSNIIDFGLQEKVVTPHTAYIVLERVEDYVRYNIAPPKELEAECEKINYVKRDTRFERRRMEEAGEFDILKNVVNIYNQRIRKWDANEKLIHFDKSEYENLNIKIIEADGKISNSNAGAEKGELTGKIAGLDIRSNALDEVVVVGYGTMRKRELTGSVVQIKNRDIFSSATSVEQILQGRVAGLHVTNTSVALGSTANTTIRGISSLNNNQPLYVIDGVPVSANVNDLVNVNDIDFITVLKDHSAAAIYGSRAAGGAIIINTKKGKNYYNSYKGKLYRLKDMEDVEYMQELKSASLAEKMVVYESLKEHYGGEAGFYFDAAQYFFEIGLTPRAFDILMNAAEAANGSQQVLAAIAYVLEYWKQYAEVINIYEQLIKDNPGNLHYRSDLAWAHYLYGNYQQSIDILYEAIKINTGQQEYAMLHTKSQLMTEMNAIISVHKDKLDVSVIPQALMKPLPVDMRIVVDCNKGNLSNGSIREPGNIICNYSTPVTKNGGSIQQTDYWYYSNPLEYQIKKAPPGKYKISVNYYDYYSHRDKIPGVIRIRTFRNFGKANQSIKVENVMMDNQYGEVEIGEEKW
ncbi:MAG: VIT domain-containing protein [Chitinophagaceae bacterium]|nr:VIT domain-containing protein [Chitinophagaceae bacterium]